MFLFLIDSPLLDLFTVLEIQFLFVNYMLVVRICKNLELNNHVDITTRKDYITVVKVN